MILRYILRVAGDTPFEDIREHIAKAAPELEEDMATAEEELIQKGVEQGIEQGVERGVEKGRVEALREMLFRLLRARFGELEPGVERRLGAASPDDLDRWIERVVTAERPEDIFGR